MTTTTLPALIQQFFTDRLCNQMEASPNTIASARVGTRVARNAPNTAPTVVATSRNIPIRTFESPSRTYAAAAPDEVAITEISDAPMA